MDEIFANLILFVVIVVCVYENWKKIKNFQLHSAKYGFCSEENLCKF